MCGIAGKIFFDQGRPVDENLIRHMCATLTHRGPDDEGLFVHKNFGFGMRRLSIIDLQSGHQPIFNEDKSIAIISNGEIYNYQELKGHLEKRGHCFSTNSDTEVVLHAFEEYGVSCLRKLNGMFAVAIWDLENQTLFLARDRLGIKPFYYYQDADQLVFGSEIKAILKDTSIFDEPFADYAAFPTYMVSKLAEEHVAVVLTGDGGDEVFAGYKRYRSEALAAYYRKIPNGIREIVIGNLMKMGARITPVESRSHRWFASALKKHRLMGLDPIRRYIHGLYKFQPRHKQDLIFGLSPDAYDYSEQAFEGYLNDRELYDGLSKRLYLDQMTSLPDDMLTKVDRVTMAVSLEARVPFLDHRIVEFAATLPSSLKMTLFTLKRFLKRSVRDSLPRKIVNRAKHGFSSPIDQ